MARGVYHSSVQVWSPTHRGKGRERGRGMNVKGDVEHALLVSPSLMTLKGDVIDAVH